MTDKDYALFERMTVALEKLARAQEKIANRPVPLDKNWVWDPDTGDELPIGKYADRKREQRKARAEASSK